MLGAIGALVLAARGCGAPYDNAATCDHFVKSARCGAVDLSAQYDCYGYGNAACDLSAYFDCLSSKYVCEDGRYDLGKRATVGECAAKATCR